MAKLGDVRKGEAIGKSNIRGYYQWANCLDCGKERWVALRCGELCNLRCSECSHKRSRLQCSIRGEKSKGWKGGRYEIPQGYILVRIQPDSPFYGMVNSHGYVMEHRLIVAQQLNRCLLPTEYVHHLNGIKNDNRIENLELLSKASHAVYNKLCFDCGLRREIRLLRSEIKNLKEAVQLKLEGK